jgi:hypothetical protein
MWIKSFALTVDGREQRRKRYTILALAVAAGVFKETAIILRTGLCMMERKEARLRMSAFSCWTWMEPFILGALFAVPWSFCEG